MSSLTTRLSLTKPAGVEAIDITVLNTDFDQIDYAVGVILVNAGVTPPNSALFDGAVVQEKVTGLQWTAVKNGGGGFDKLYNTSGVSTAWSSLNMGGGWSSVSGTYPLPAVKKQDGMLLFSGAAYSGGISANVGYTVGSHTYITAGAHPNVTTGMRQAGVYTAGGGVAVCSYFITTVGTLIFASPAAASALVINLDGISFRDYSAPL